MKIFILILISLSILYGCQNIKIVEKQSWQPHKQFIKQVAWIDNERVMTASGDKKAILHNINTQKQEQIYEHEQLVLGVAPHPNNSDLVAVSSWDKSIRIFDLKQKKQVQELKDHKGWISNMEFSHKGELLSIGAEKEAYIWDNENQTAQTLADDIVPYCISSTKKDDFIAVGTMNGQIIIYQDKQVVSKLNKITEGNAITQVKFFGDNQQYTISSTWGNKIHIHDWAQEKLLLTLESHQGPVQSIDYNDNYLISSSEDKTVKVWDLELISKHLQDNTISSIQQDLLLLATIQSHSNFVWWAALNGNHIASGDESGQLVISEIQCLEKDDL